ncbi:MAG: ornithine cyclodeaminase family protein [bacterium]|nr:ornithine cyclodeaminase family protein [bacterium]
MKPKIFNLEQIKKALESLDPIEAMGQGFCAYSMGKAVIPPVGELLFDSPPGDVHIKYGFIKAHQYFVIKVASGFYQNAALDLPSCNGLMLVFKQQTGELACVLLDEGHLTNVRTAAAGAVAAKYLAPRDVKRIGVLGTGIQGRMQLQYLKSVTSCKDIFAWNINPESLAKYKTIMEKEGYRVATTQNSREVAENCNLIVTATPSKLPLLEAQYIQDGTHITAMGSDTSDKQELDAAILAKADIVAVDSLSQSRSRGEVYRAVTAGTIDSKKPVELGNVILDKSLQRQSEKQITVADLTGVAIQDIQVAVAVYEALE